MKKLLIAFISLIVLANCNFGKETDSKEKDAANLNNNDNYISQRHLHNQKFKKFTFTSEQQWDSLNNTSHKKTIYKKGKVHPDVRTFGWHLYSNGSSYTSYNFSMLWGISYFSYAVQPETGNYKNIHQWKTTALIDSAKAKDCKVFLSVSNFGSTDNATFLKNSKARETLIDSVSSLLALRSADGINIDFEGVPKESKKSFMEFIVQISKKLKQDNPKYMISLCLYAVDWNHIFDIKAIDSYVDFYTLMGYDYHGSFSKTTGPVTPFKTSKKFGNGLESSVNYYKNQGVLFNKLIVGLPYYGAEWYTQSAEIGAKVTKFKSHPPY